MKNAEELFQQVQPLVQLFLKRSGGLQENGERNSYAPWVKEAVYSFLQTSPFNYQEVSNLTGISVKTLEKFKEFVDQLKLEKGETTELHLLVEQAWAMATHQEKKH
jgi:hypothetical protein